MYDYLKTEIKLRERQVECGFTKKTLYVTDRWMTCTLAQVELALIMMAPFHLGIPNKPEPFGPSVRYYDYEQVLANC